MNQRNALQELKGAGRLSLTQQVALNLMRSQDHLLQQSQVLFKQVGLSEPQYNVLRILRAAADTGLPCQAIAERMLTKGPDVTRLVDRLSQAGYVRRLRDGVDRRVVTVRITPAGIGILEGLDQPVLDLHQRQFKGLTHDELRILKRLLVKLRQ